MSPERLAAMANQIARFFASQGGGGGAAAVAEHLRLFWDPRMRADILRHLEAGGEGLDPLVVEALGILRAERT